MRQHSDNWVKWFEKNSPETEYFLYLIDESPDFQQIEKWSKWLANNPGPGHRLKSMATQDLPKCAKQAPTLQIVSSGFQLGIAKDWEDVANKYSHDPVRRFFLYNGKRRRVPLLRPKRRRGVARHRMDAVQEAHQPVLVLGVNLLQ